MAGRTFADKQNGKGSLFFFAMQEGSNTADSVKDGLPFLLNGLIDSSWCVLYKTL